MNECDVTFEAMGCEVRLIIGAPRPGERSPAAAAERAQQFIERFDRALSRFKPDSELCALNADPRTVVPASNLLRRAVHAGLWSADQTDGLVDPTLVREIESIGYARSRAGIAPASLGDALALAPARQPARPDPRRRWCEIEVDDEEGVIRRPPGIAFDTGGSGKGLAADMVVAALRGYARVVVDCGGDVRIGGFAAKALPFEVQIEHPLTGARAHSLRMGSGGIATSGLNVRVWRRDDGTYAHHLLDPATGKPAWTGIVGATAIGDTALEAETISKAALLSGPDGARRLLAQRGGLIVHEDGQVEVIGPLPAQPRFSITLPSTVAEGKVAA
jgi:thiamine biosynthesis lipoprotein